ncbi:hypothetical protein JCM5296_001968 [Sporobolomyces johnsonii]
MRFTHALIAAAVFRAGLILWGTYQDAVSPVRYTDIDYFVFSDAATCLLAPTSPNCSPARGRLAPAWMGDPYSRSTYRYTPLLSILVAPNSLLPVFGKVLFSLCDLLVGTMLYRLLRSRGSSPKTANRTVAIAWLLNPMIANISTRGSSESVVGALVVGVLALAEEGRWDATAVLYGVAVHFKLFPVIYGSSLLVATAFPTGRTFSLARTARFVLLSFAAFMALNVPLYLIWGEPFLDETFLYHLRRLDHRHNFSPYFYPYYLSASPTVSRPDTALHTLASHPLAAFVQQMALSIGLGFAFGGRDLPYAWLVQTFAFVAFNKVCTSQYFLWFLWLLPPALSRIQLSVRRAVVAGSIWVAGQAIWLSQAYRLEIAGDGGYKEVWAAGVLFFLAQCWVLRELLAGYRSPSPASKG